MVDDTGCDTPATYVANDQGVIGRDRLVTTVLPEVDANPHHEPVAEVRFCSIDQCIEPASQLISSKGGRAPGGADRETKLDSRHEDGLPSRAAAKRGVGFTYVVLKKDACSEHDADGALIPPCHQTNPHCG